MTELHLIDAIFGKTDFIDGEEYKRFQYRFACSIILFSISITTLFHIAAYTGKSQFDQTYLLVYHLYLIVSILYYFLLRGHPRRLPFIAWTYAALSCCLHGATLFLNTPDELRIIWFALNLPGIYVVLGSTAGIGVTVLSILFVIAANPHLPVPYSPSAIATCVLGMTYLSAFFHAFSSRSISFHHAMVTANAKLAEMAAKDPLTGLYNGRAFYALCDSAHKQAQRSQSPFAMLFIDLDHFKSINDGYGHEAGDIVLKGVGAMLMETARQSDVVGRIGGEEFSVLLPHTDQEGALNMAEKVRAEIESLMPDIGERKLKVTASIGVAWSGTANMSIAAVQKQADEAMYEAKKSGRNRVTSIA